jgi:hypothetical protein
MEMTSYAKARSNLWMLDDANTEKQSLDLLFLSSPKQYLQSSLKRHRGQTQLVPRLHIKMYQVKISNQTRCHRIRNQILGINT